MEDLQILDLYWRRDERAIRETDARYGAYLHAIAWNILSDREDAEKCVNDTYHQAWNAIPPDRPACLWAWPGRVCRNIALNLWNKNHAKKRGSDMELLLSELEDCIPAPDGPERRAEDAAIRDCLNAWLRGLPAEDRALFVRRYWYGETPGALAEERKLPAKKLTQKLLSAPKRTSESPGKGGYHIMMEARIRLYQAIGGIDVSLVEEALRPVRVEKRPVRLRLLAAVASFLLLLTGAAALLASRTAPAEPVRLETSPEDPRPVETVPVAKHVPPDYDPITVEQLALPDAVKLAEPYAGAGYFSADILPFLEDSLGSCCCGILGGTVLRVYPKRYEYACYHDKFGPMELFHAFVDTLVYELAVEKVWYGDAFTPGTSVLVEDVVFYLTNFSLREGQCCVIPLCIDYTGIICSPRIGPPWRRSPAGWWSWRKSGHMRTISRKSSGWSTGTTSPAA